MQCPNCGNFIADQVTVCTSCGAGLAIRKVCPQCNHQEETTSVYCTECGYLLLKEVICTTEGMKKASASNQKEEDTEKVSKAEDKKTEKKKARIEKRLQKAIAKEKKKAEKKLRKAEKRIVKKKADGNCLNRIGCFLKIVVVLILVAAVLLGVFIWYEAMYDYEPANMYMAEEDSVLWVEKSNVLMSQHFILPEGIESYHQMSEESAFATPGARMDIGSITFLDSIKTAGNCWDVSEAGDGSVMAWVDYNSSQGYYDMFIGAEGGVIAPENCAGLFSGYINAEYIRFNGAFDISHVSDISYLFYGCKNLKEVDLSGFDTANVTNMSGLFSVCESIEMLDLSGFDTARVTDMRWMFDDCHSLKTLDISGFDTSNVVTMRGMFAICTSLSQVDLTHFDTSNVTDMAAMFSGCENLKELDIANFDTSQVTNMRMMFRGVSEDFVLHYSLETFDTSNVTEYEYFMSDSFDWKKLFE